MWPACFFPPRFWGLIETRWGTYIHSCEVMFEQALENHTLNTDILKVKLWPFSRSWHGHPSILNLKLHYLLTQYTFLNSVFHFNVILIIIWDNKCHKILQKSVGLHDLLETGTLNVDTWRPIAEKYTLFLQISWNWYRKRGPRGPWLCLKNIPFPVFFCSNMTSCFARVAPPRGLWISTGIAPTWKWHSMM